MKFFKYWIFSVLLMFGIPTSSIAEQDVGTSNIRPPEVFPFPGPEFKYPILDSIILGQTSADNISELTGKALRLYSVFDSSYVKNNSTDTSVAKSSFSHAGFYINAVFYHGIIVELKILSVLNSESLNNQLVKNLRKDFDVKFKREKTVKSTSLQSANTRRVINTRENWTERNGAFSVEIDEHRGSLIVSKLKCLSVAYNLKLSFIADSCSIPTEIFYTLTYRYRPGHDKALAELKLLDAAKKAADKEAEERLRSKF